MRGILAAHQLPPTQHLSQSMNIEWPPPPAFGVRRGLAGAGGRLRGWEGGGGREGRLEMPPMFISLIDIFSPFSSGVLPVPQSAASQKVSGLQ